MNLKSLIYGVTVFSDTLVASPGTLFPVTPPATYVYDKELRGVDRIALWIDYTSHAASAIGFPRIYIGWGWDFAPMPNPYRGVILAGHVLEDEYYDLPTPGAPGTVIRRVIELEVPPSTYKLRSSIEEVGDILNPGSAVVRMGLSAAAT